MFTTVVWTFRGTRGSSSRKGSRSDPIDRSTRRNPFLESRLGKDSEVEGLHRSQYYWLEKFPRFYIYTTKDGTRYRRILSQWCIRWEKGLIFQNNDNVRGEWVKQYTLNTTNFYRNHSKTTTNVLSHLRLRAQVGWEKLVS